MPLPNSTSRRTNRMNQTQTSKRTIIAVTAAIGALLFALSPIVRLLVFGWILFLWRVVPDIEMNWAVAGIGAVSFAGVVFLTHHLATWIRRQQPESNHPWRFRSSLSIAALVVVMFVAGIAAAGIAHQVVWLLRSSSDLIVSKIDNYNPADDLGVSNQMRTVELAIRNYASRRNVLPFENEETGVQVSWPTRIVGYLYSPAKAYYDRDGNFTWDHERNRDYFSRVFPDLLNPMLENAPQHNSDGYGVSHYELNENVVNVSIEEYDRGTSQTILVGEVNSQFEPWGKPNTHRDVNLGLNRHPHGFGGPPSRDGVMFLLLDGSVRTVSDTIDPEVLRAMSGAQ